MIVVWNRDKNMSVRLTIYLNFLNEIIETIITIDNDYVDLTRLKRINAVTIVCMFV